MEDTIQFKYNEELMTKFAAMLKKEYVQQLIKAGKGGTIDKTIRMDVVIAGSLYEVQMRIEDYAKFIESGRKVGWGKKGTTPQFLPAILKWVRKKNIGIKKGLTRKQTAYIIARSIAKNGIKALPIMSKSIKTAETIFYRKLAEALQLDVKNNIRELFEIQN